MLWRQLLITMPSVGHVHSRVIGRRLFYFYLTSPAPYDHPRRVESRADRRSGAEMDGSRGRWAPASLAERRGPPVGDESLAVKTECVSASDEGIRKGRIKASRAPSFRL